MDARRRLEANLASESEAYGYTLTIWGAGALLIQAFGVPSVEHVIAYVTGALAAFGALALVAFQGVSTEVTVPDTPSSLVASTVHLLSTSGALGTTYLLVETAGSLDPLAVFFAAGFLATAGYNLLLLLESLVVRELD